MNRSLTCPQCRSSTNSYDIIRLHLSMMLDDEYKSLEDQVNELKKEINLKNELIEKLTKDNTDIISQMAELRLFDINKKNGITLKK